MIARRLANKGATQAPTAETLRAIKDVRNAGAMAVRAQQMANLAAMADVVLARAQEDGIDLTKWRFDLSALAWREIPVKPATPPETLGGGNGVV